MTENTDPDDVAFLIVDTARLLRAEFERQVSEAGLSVTPGEARLLVHLSRCGPIQQHELASRLGISRMSLTNYVDRLEGDGLAIRKDDPSDRRAKIVEVTQAAKSVLDDIARIGRSVRSVARGSINETQWRQFANLVYLTRSNLASARLQLHDEKQDA